MYTSTSYIRGYKYSFINGPNMQNINEAICTLLGI